MRAPTFIILPFLVNITLASVNSPDEDPGTFNSRPNSIIETSSSSSSNFYQESGNDIFEDQNINKVGKKDSSFRDKGKDKETTKPLVNSTLETEGKKLNVSDFEEVLKNKTEQERQELEEQRNSKQFLSLLEAFERKEYPSPLINQIIKMINKICCMLITVPKERPIIPIFVMGSPRSGTTLIGNYIGSCDKVCNFIEYPGFCAAADLVPNYQSRVYADYKPSYHSSLFNHAEDFSEMETRGRGYEAYVDSNPSNLKIIEKLRSKIYPAIFIIMLRDYRGVILSLEKSYNNPPGRSWPGKDDEERAQLYYEFYKNLMNISPEEVIYLNYDQLFINPNETLNEFDKNFYTKLTTLFNIQNPQDKWGLSRQVFGESHAPNISSSSSSTNTPPQRFFKVEGLGKEVNLTPPVTGPYNKEEWSSERDEKVKEEIGKLVRTFKKEKPYASSARLEKDPAFDAFFKALTNFNNAADEELKQRSTRRSQKACVAISVTGVFFIMIIIVACFSNPCLAGVIGLLFSGYNNETSISPLHNSTISCKTGVYSQEYFTNTCLVKDHENELSAGKQSVVKRADRRKDTYTQSSIPFIWNVPFRNENFVGRATFLESLHATLVNPSRDSSYVAITAMPGTGKTQVAKEYANSYREEYDIIWWFDGTLDLDKQYENLAHLINEQLEFCNKGLDQYAQFARITEDFTFKVKNYLRQTNYNCLLIFDDVPDEASIIDYIPENHNSNSYTHIIATSKNSMGWSSSRHLKTFDLSESIKLLNKLTDLKDDPSADALAELLECFPLAIAQAGAYIQQRHLSSFQDYIDLYKTKRQELEQDEETLRQQDNPVAYDKYEATIARTLSLALDAIQQESPEAFELLTLSAFIHKRNILKETLAGWMNHKRGDSFISLGKAINQLRKYSIIEDSRGQNLHGTRNEFDLHELVQRATRDKIFLTSSAIPTKLSEQQKVKEICSFFASKAEDLFNIDFYSPKGHKKSSSYLSHILALIKHAKELEITHESLDEIEWIGKILFLVGKSSLQVNSELKHNDNVKNEYQQALDQAEVLFGNTNEKGSINALNQLLAIIENSHPEVQSRIGYLFHKGLWVEIDYQESLNWHLKADERGSASASFNLGVMHDEGEFVPQNKTKAINYYRKSAAQDYPLAAFNLAWMHAYSDGIAQNSYEAIKLYREAAKQGYPEAYSNIGVLYEDGRGVPQDDEKAITCYRMAAAQGDPYAKSNLGLYAEKDGNFQEAKAIYEEIIQEGTTNKFAYLDLAYLLENHPELYEGTEEERIEHIVYLQKQGQSMRDVWLKSRKF